MEKSHFLRDAGKFRVGAYSSIRGDQISVRKINKMRKNVASRGRNQGGWCIGVQKGGKFPCANRPIAQLRADRGLAHQPMVTKRCQAVCYIDHGRAMARQHQGPIVVHQTLQRGEVGAHVPVGRRYKTCGPAHGMVAGKQNRAKAKAEMFGHMAGRVPHDQIAPVARQNLAIAQAPVRAEAAVDSLSAARHSLGGEPLHQRASCLARCGEGADWCAGCARQGAR